MYVYCCSSLIYTVAKMYKHRDYGPSTSDGFSTIYGPFTLGPENMFANMCANILVNIFANVFVNMFATIIGEI